MLTLILAVNAISGVITGLLFWYIGKSYNNPERLEGIRSGRIKKFKALAFAFIIYAITNSLLPLLASGKISLNL